MSTLGAVSPATPNGGVQSAMPIFRWYPVANATNYDIWVNDVTKGQFQVLRDQNVTGTSWMPTKPLNPGDTYQWLIRALDSQGDSSNWSSTVQFTVLLLNNPEPLAPAGNTDRLRPTFTWTPVANADMYDIWLTNVTTGQNPVQRNTTATGSAWTPSTPLIAGDTYAWYVRALSNNGDVSAWTGPFEFTVNPLATPTPKSPTGTVALTSAASLTPTFTWNSVSDADSYEVYVDDNNTKLYDLTVHGNAWAPSTPLNVGDTYTWWVRAFNSQDGNESAWSSPATFQIQSPAPQLIAPAGNIVSLTPTFSWNGVNGASSYLFCLQNDTAGGSVNGTVQNTAATLNGRLIVGDTYTWWVRAQNATGAGGAWSAPLTFTVQPLAAPHQVAPSGNITTTTPAFVWNTVAGADSYEISIAANNATVYDQTLAAPQTASAQLTWTAPAALTPGVQYQWWIRALNNTGNQSAWSGPMTFTIQKPGLGSAVLIGPQGTILNNSSFNYEWNAVPGATEYQVAVYDQTTGAYVINEAVYNMGDRTSPARTTLANTVSLNPNDKYTWWVRAFVTDASGNFLQTGAWSASQSFNINTGSSGIITDN
jgi:hypothetical protein